MSPTKGPNIIRFSVIISTTLLTLIFLALIPISRKAWLWNSCFNSTIGWINEKENDLDDWDKTAKEALAVGVCNGAVYEPRLKTN